MPKPPLRIRSVSLHGALVGAGVCLAVSLIAAVVLYLWHSGMQEDRAALAAELETLRAEISTMEKTAAELAGKTWRLELATWKEERGIILPKGVKVDRTAPLTDKSGRIAIILKP